MFFEGYFIEYGLMFGFSCNKPKRIEIFLGVFALCIDWSGEGDDD